MGTKNTASGAVMGEQLTATDKLGDRQASAQLKVLHNSYKALNKKRPKSPAEAVTLPLIFNADAAGLAAVDAAYDTAKNEWRKNMNTLLHSINDLGASNPGAPISIFDEKSGRTVQKNGKELCSALLREEAIALRGTAQ